MSPAGLGVGEQHENFRVYISIVYTLAIVCANFERNLRTFVFLLPPAGLGVGCVGRGVHMGSGVVCQGLDLEFCKMAGGLWILDVC